MVDALKGLMQSKKFIGMIVGCVITLTAKVGLDVDDSTIWQIVALISTWVGAQGIADHAKEKAKIENGKS
jgi:hypothetical protein